MNYANKLKYFVMKCGQGWTEQGMKGSNEAALLTGDFSNG